MPEFFDCEQGSEDWFRVRMGIPTASEFKTVLAKSATDSKSRRTYMLKLAGEVLTGSPMESYTNWHMERGKGLEPEARDLYAHYQECQCDQIGFIRNGDAGCSPDSLIGADGMLEIKTKLPHLHLDVLLRGEFPADHKAQCQGALWIAERDWIDLAVYWPGLPLFVKRAYRDDLFISDLSRAVDAFNAELAEIVAKVRAISGPLPSLKQQLEASLAHMEATP